MMSETRQTRKRWWVLAGVCAVAIGAGAAWWSASRTLTAEDTAHVLLLALETGDTDLLAATGVEVSDAARTAFAQADEYLSSSAVTGSEASDSATIVTVVYELGGQEHRADVRFHRGDDGWIAASDTLLGAVTVEADWGADAAVGASLIPLGVPTALLPARYEVHASPRMLLDEVPTVAVLAGRAHTVTLESPVNETLIAAAQAQLDAHLQACTVSAREVPANCGIRIPWGADLVVAEQFRHRIEQYPAVALDPERFHATGGTLVTTVSGIDHAGDAASFTYRASEWGVRGDVLLTPEEAVLQVW